LPTKNRKYPDLEIGVFFCCLEKIDFIGKITDKKAYRRNKADLLSS
jgi:hypothetical protein